MALNGSLRNVFGRRSKSLKDVGFGKGAKDSSGYGMIGIGLGHIERAHRIAYQLRLGEILEGQFVCHKCDVKACVNPEHLFLATSAENTKDAVVKGLQTGHPPKLTELEVKRIREYHINSIPQKTIAKEFGVDQSTISLIVNGHTWKRLN